MNVVSYFKLQEMRWLMPPEDCERMEGRFPGVRILVVDKEDDLPYALPDADAFVGWDFPQDYFRYAKKLKWVHSASAGADGNLFSEMRRSDIVVTTSAGLHGTCIPEHILAQMFVLARNFHEAMRLQVKCEWNRFQVVSFAATICEIQGSHLLILGAGAIGRGLATRAAALGMQVRVCRRDPSRPVPGAEAVIGKADLHEHLRWADFVVCALPLTDDTYRMISYPELMQMKSSAFLINVGRGETLDERALQQILQRNAIAGAALDVFLDEPLVREHPFWTMPNLVITPHISGYMPDYFTKVMALFEEQLERYYNGRPLRNLVNKELGYARSEDPEEPG